MKRIKRLFWTLSLMLTMSCTAEISAVTLPDAVSDNMVLQQNTAARLWGWSKPGNVVEVKTSWNGKKYSARANDKGRWDVMVATPSASFEPYEISFKDKDNKKTVNNVLIGEVWFCSGQSNMEMPLNGFWTQPIEGSNKAIAYSGQYKGLRMMTVEKRGAVTPQDSVRGTWKVSNPENAQWFSAVGYFFAEAMTKMLNCPIGIINCSWGGSHVEGWMPREDLLAYSDIDLSEAGNPKVREWDQPMIMYNGQLHPLIGYTIKGILWNQGESNVGHDKVYAERLAKMVQIWRDQWGQKETIPFYMVEIPPYSYGDVNATNAAMLREAQHKAAKIIPNSGIVSTSDLTYPYEVEDIHASKKQELGERLAFMAMCKTYGMKGVKCDSPEFRSMDVDGNTVVLHFDNAEDGFTPNRNITGFEVAGEDKVFYPAQGEELFETRDIRLTSDKVKKIVAVRYCFKNCVGGTVHNLRWLPLVPFRTDNWEK